MWILSGKVVQQPIFTGKSQSLRSRFFAPPGGQQFRRSGILGCSGLWWRCAGMGCCGSGVGLRICGLFRVGFFDLFGPCSCLGMRLVGRVASGTRRRGWRWGWGWRNRGLGFGWGAASRAVGDNLFSGGRIDAVKDLCGHGDHGESVSQRRFHVEPVEAGYQGVGDEEDE